MIIRDATKEDLPRILELGKQFGHQMAYQKDPVLMEKYLPRIIVAEDPGSFTLQGLETVNRVLPEVVGYYHYIVSGDTGFIEMLDHYRQFRSDMILEAAGYKDGDLCVVMQGGCHRDAFWELVWYLQKKYSYLWCYNSITGGVSSSKIAGYKALGFIYVPKDQYTFFNVGKGDFSTYWLGKWSKR